MHGIYKRFSGIAFFVSIDNKGMFARWSVSTSAVGDVVALSVFRNVVFGQWFFVFAET